MLIILIYPKSNYSFSLNKTIMALNTVFDATLENIYHSNSLMYYFCRLTGLAPYSFQRINNRIVIKTDKFDWFYLMASLAFYLFISLYSVFSILADDKNFNIIGKYFIIIIVITMVITIYFSIIAIFIIRKTITKTFLFFANFDFALISHQINVNSKLVLHENLIFLLMMAISITLRVYFMLKTLNVDFILQFTLFATVTVLTLTKFIFISLVRNIRCRFMEIYKQFEAINGANLNDIEMVIKMLKFLSKQHYKLCHILRKLNKSFGLLLLFSTAVAFADMLFQSYYLAHVIFNYVPNLTKWMIICPSFWLIVEIIDTILLVISCAQTCEYVNIDHFYNIYRYLLNILGFRRIIYRTYFTI